MTIDTNHRQHPSVKSGGECGKIIVADYGGPGRPGIRVRVAEVQVVDARSKECS